MLTDNTQSDTVDSMPANTVPRRPRGSKPLEGGQVNVWVRSGTVPKSFSVAPWHTLAIQAWADVMDSDSNSAALREVIEDMVKARPDVRAKLLSLAADPTGVNAWLAASRIQPDGNAGT